jgi:hypothetical protein
MVRLARWAALAFLFLSAPPHADPIRMVIPKQMWVELDVTIILTCQCSPHYYGTPEDRPDQITVECSGTTSAVACADKAVEDARRRKQW